MSKRAVLLVLISQAALLCSCTSRLPYEGKSLTELEDMLIDDDPRIQAQGAFAACQDTDKARQLTAPLIGALRSKDAEVRRLAAQGLGQTDGTDANVVPALMAALSDSSWKVKRSAALALGQLGPKATQALPGLKKLSRASEKLVREAALKGIEQITKKY